MKIQKIKLPGELPEEKLLFDLPETETLQLGYVSLRPGESNTERSHPDEEEIYLVLGGTADLRLGDEVASVTAGDTVYVPRNTVHQLTCTSAEPLEYLYVANYPDLPLTRR